MRSAEMDMNFLNDKFFFRMHNVMSEFSER